MTETQIDNSIEQKVERMLDGSPVRRSPMIARRKEKFDFWQIYGMVLGLLIIVIGGCLGFLWQNLQLYEHSLPERVLEQYRHPLIQGGLPRIVVYEAAKPAKYESAAEKDSFIRDLLAEGDLTFSCLAEESNADRKVYLCTAGETALATVTLERIHTGRFGHWEAVDEESRMPIYGDIRIIAPQDALVTINGVAVFGEDLDRAGLPYEELAAVSFTGDAVPLQDEYAVRGLYREPLIEAWGIENNVLEMVSQETEGALLIRILPNTAEETWPPRQKMGLADAHIFSNVLTGDAEPSALAERMAAGSKTVQDLQAAHVIEPAQEPQAAQTQEPQAAQATSYPAHSAVSFSDEAVSSILLYSPDCLSMDIDFTCTLDGEDGEVYACLNAWTIYYQRLGDVWMIVDILPRLATANDRTANDMIVDNTNAQGNDD